MPTILAGSLARKISRDNTAMLREHPEDVEYRRKLDELVRNTPVEKIMECFSYRRVLFPPRDVCGSEEPWPYASCLVPYLNEVSGTLPEYQDVPYDEILDEDEVSNYATARRTL